VHRLSLIHACLMWRCVRAHTHITLCLAKVEHLMLSATGYIFCNYNEKMLIISTTIAMIRLANFRSPAMMPREPMALLELQIGSPNSLSRPLQSSRTSCCVASFPLSPPPNTPNGIIPSSHVTLVSLPQMIARRVCVNACSHVCHEPHRKSFYVE
jgi:hypothetical protein